jgi:SAM-dependent methyltransferase
MASQPSGYVIRGGLEGRERLRVLGRVMRPTTLALFERVGLRAGMVCLDVGCGGGDATVEMARCVGPSGRVVGIDLDAAKIELARREAAALQLSNVEFRVVEAGQGGAAGEFDFVYARFLLTHLPDPAATLQHLTGRLRRGGTVVLEDIDFSGHFCHPHSPAFWRYVELYMQVARRRGGDPNIGPRLPALLLGCGLESIGMHVVQPAGFDGEVKLINPLTLENVADAVLADGLASQAELDGIIRELYACAEDRRTVLSLPRVVQAWGVLGAADHE